MKVVIQRVLDANIKVEEKEIAKIEKGIVVLLGIANEDTYEKVDRMIKKITNLRIFSDEDNKMNLSIKDIDGELLIVSQFTLFADCKNGNRPSFTEAGKPEIARRLYEYFIEKCKQSEIKTNHGVFGADMKINLTNDGPVTILLEN